MMQYSFHDAVRDTALLVTAGSAPTAPERFTRCAGGRQLGWLSENEGLFTPDRTAHGF